MPNPLPPSTTSLLVCLKHMGPQRYQQSKSATAAWGKTQISVLPVKLRDPWVQIDVSAPPPPGSQALEQAKKMAVSESHLSFHQWWCCAVSSGLAEMVGTALAVLCPPVHQQWYFFMGVSGCSDLYTLPAAAHTTLQPQSSSPARPQKTELQQAVLAHPHWLASQAGGRRDPLCWFLSVLSA